MSRLLLPLPPSDAACRDLAAVRRLPVAARRSLTLSRGAWEFPNHREPSPHRSPKSHPFERPIARSCRLSSCRSRADPSLCSGVSGWARCALAAALEERRAPTGFTPRPLSCPRRPSRAIRLASFPQSRRAKACQARLTAPLGGPDGANRFRTSPLAWERDGINPGRQRPMFATHDSFFKS